MPPLRFFFGVVCFGASRSAAVASRSASAERLTSACSFLSSMRFFAGASWYGDPAATRRQVADAASAGAAGVVFEV